MTKLYLIEQSFGDKISGEFEDIGRSIADFFKMIKSYTYDPLCELWGESVVNLLGIGIGTVLIMIILIKIINRD